MDSRRSSTSDRPLRRSLVADEGRVLLHQLRPERQRRIHVVWADAVLEVDVHVEAGIAVVIEIGAGEAGVAIPAIELVLAGFDPQITRIEVEVLTVRVAVLVAVRKEDRIGLALDLAVDLRRAVV